MKPKLLRITPPSKEELVLGKENEIWYVFRIVQTDSGVRLCKISQTDEEGVRFRLQAGYALLGSQEEA